MFDQTSLASFLAAGAALEKSIPTGPGTVEQVERLLHRYREDTAGQLLPIVHNWMRQGQMGVLRWCDFLHVPQRFATKEEVRGEHNKHEIVFVDPAKDKDLAGKYEDLWNWYSERDSYRLFMMARTFDWSGPLPGVIRPLPGVILTNEPNVAGHPLGYAVFCVDRAVSLIGSYCNSDRLRFLNSTEKDWDRLAAKVDDSIGAVGDKVDVLYTMLVRNASEALQVRRALARYLVAMYFYEESVIVDPRELYFYYWFEPYLPSVARMYTGTGLGFHARTMPCDYSFASQIAYLNNIWARYVVRAETYHRFMMSAHYSARAAIMSRNLSHNLGSHALANTRLFDAIGVLGEMKTAPRPIEENHPLVFVHPDGSSGSVRQREAWNARTRLQSLNSYLQGRMDFIAKAIGESQGQSEAIFFVNELVRGFLSQTVLLNTLLSDNGYTAKDLSFIVRIHRAGERFEDVVPVTFSPSAPDGAIRHDVMEMHLASGSVDDVLLSVPGGMVGRHAFYAFMENILRNAAKYGKHSRSKGGGRGLAVSLVLSELGPESGVARSGGLTMAGGSCYALTIQDNLSEDKDGEVVEKIRTYLSRGIIDKDGRTSPEGHGVQEMSLCAHFLAGGDGQALTIPRGDRHNGTDAVGCCATGPEQGGGGSLECVVEPWRGAADHESGAVERVLTYRMLVDKPLFLGICLPTQAHASASIRMTSPSSSSVCYYRTLRAMCDAAESPMFALVPMADSDADLAALLEVVTHLHTGLPYRLLLVVDDGKKKSVKERIASWQANRWEEWVSAGGDAKSPVLPFNRVRVCARSDIFPGKAVWSDAPDLQDVESAAQEDGGWNQTILRVYDAWLGAYKGEELAEARQRTGKAAGTCKWQLMIAFERDPDLVFAKWGATGDGIGARRIPFSSSQVDLHIVSKETDMVDPSRASSNPEIDPFSPELRLFKIVFDNHGKALDADEAGRAMDESVAAWQQFSGNGQLALFQLLFDPPSDPFTRSMFVLSLAEAMLTRVAVVDERVADSSIDRSGGQPLAFFDSFLRLQKARVHPVLTVRAVKSENGDRIEHRLSETVRRGFQEVRIARDQGKWNIFRRVDGFEPEKGEGLLLADRRATLVIPWRLTGGLGAGRSSGNLLPDVIVIHEGVSDVLNDRGVWPVGQHRSFYALSPVVVRTSGRGATSRHLGFELPFLEFSELSESTYRQFNKLHLARGLLALRGRPIT